ncbi:MAG: hypothetical protein LRY71_19170 [Bacillaceae bacterium]|nr:hypothetical protein [Bacillaceae bacterium]
MNTIQMLDLIDKKVMSDLIVQGLDRELRALSLYQVNRELVGTPGTTLTLPTRSFRGIAQKVGEKEELALQSIDETFLTLQAERFGTAFETTGLSTISSLDDLMVNLAQFSIESIAKRIDLDGIQALQSLSNETRVLTVGSNGITFDDIIEAVFEIDPERTGANQIFLLVSVSEAKQIMKLNNFVSLVDFTVIDPEIRRGLVGTIGGVHVVSTKALRDGEAYALTETAFMHAVKQDPAITIEHSGRTDVRTLSVNAYGKVQIVDYNQIVALRRSNVKPLTESERALQDKGAPRVAKTNETK